MCRERRQRFDVHAPTGDTGDTWLNLLVATIRLAVDDAQAGDAQAAAWLWSVAPTVARRKLADLVEVSESEKLS